MDQTKFINSYINNLAEQLKASTLDNIMLKTQLAMANETVAELTVQLQAAQDSAKPTAKKSTKSDWEESNFTKDEQDR